MLRSGKSSMWCGAQMVSTPSEDREAVMAPGSTPAGILYFL